MIIKLEPTGSFETFRGAQYRLFTGITDKGVKLHMLGMFRIPDANERARFEAEIAAVPIIGPAAHLLTTEGLSKT